MDIYIGGKRHRLDPAQSVGKGGEADIYKIEKDLVVKVFKQPDHPDVAGNAFEESAAKARLAEHQIKLRLFPAIHGAKVVVPRELATDKTGREVLGYTMAFVSGAEVMLRYSERSFRGANPDQNTVSEIFQGLHETVRMVHQAKVVMGDFNDLNVLVKDDEAWVIDADSFQYDNFLCKVYTERYVDPLNCDSKATRPMLVKPHTKLSDWYAYNVMLFRSLLLCDPFGGVYKPAKKSQEILHGQRSLKRISVFHKDVRYPKPALPLGLMPDELMDWFQKVFQEDLREEFRLELLKNFRWHKCTGCGLEHGRPTCPSCQKASPAAVRAVVQVRGKVTSTRIFKTDGEILYATAQDDKLLYLYREGLKDYREGGVPVGGALYLGAKIRLSGSITMYGHREKVFSVSQGQHRVQTETAFVDTAGNQPIFDANADKRFWVVNGTLFRNGTYGPERIGDVLQGQTLFWVGPVFGFGFYRAGNLSVAFVFEAEKGGLNDTVKPPPMNGQLVDATAYFSRQFCWFLYSMKEGGRLVNRAVMMSHTGAFQGAAEAEEGDGSWLGSIHGKCASANHLFSVTDDGLVRLAADGKAITKTAEFPDTEPFVHSGCSLFPGTGGLYVVDRQEIRLLKIGP